MSSKDERIHRILLGETDVIDEAVRTGDTSLIPALRQRLNMETDQERRRYDQLALAKLRDRDTLQAVFCEIEEVAGVDTDGWRKLRYIGGGFSIRTLATLFDRDPEFGKILKKKKLSRQRGNDVLFLRPSEVALVLLPEFVSNPPWTGGYTLYGSKERQEELRVWHEWINTHGTEIEQVQPNGEGVTFSKAGCSKRK